MTRSPGPRAAGADRGGEEWRSSSAFFDLLAYAIPGALYLTTFAYVAHRAGWIDVPTVLQAPSLLLLITLTVAAFLTGQAATPLGSMVDRLNPFGPRRLAERAKEEFLRRNAGAAPRRFLQVDPFTLLAAIEVGDKEAATDVVRLRSTAAMLSRCGARARCWPPSSRSSRHSPARCRCSRS